MIFPLNFEIWFLALIYTFVVYKASGSKTREKYLIVDMWLRTKRQFAKTYYSELIFSTNFDDRSSVFKHESEFIVCNYIGFDHISLALGKVIEWKSWRFSCFHCNRHIAWKDKFDGTENVIFLHLFVSAVFMNVTYSRFNM